MYACAMARLTSPLTTRFAPSPTGRLHVGHAYAALFAARLAEATAGTCLLRFEDLDQSRSRVAYEQEILAELGWLGLQVPSPVMRQSGRNAAYGHALQRLSDQGLVYPCFCTRKEIIAEIEAASAAPHLRRAGPDGPLYPGTCRRLSADERAGRLAQGEPHALRLNATRLAEHLSTRPITYTELLTDQAEATAPVPRPIDPCLFGDAVLRRKDAAASYHLAVVVDDAASGITLVTRGADLAPAIHLQRALQEALGLPEPLYAHHRLLTDETGKRLATRSHALSLAALKEKGLKRTALETLFDKAGGDLEGEIQATLSRLEKRA